MAFLLDIAKVKVYRVLHLTFFVCLVYINSNGITPASGLNFGQVRSLLVAESNRSIEIAVAVPFEMPSGLVDCCLPNSTYCDRFGSHCVCQQRGTECRCICPSENAFPDGFHFNLNGCCPTNNTYCSHHGSDCTCQEDDSTCRCVCTPAYDYTVRLAAGIAIILLIGVSIMLAVSLYRRAVLSRRHRESRINEASLTAVPEPPPDYADIYVISTPRSGAASDFEKLPTYDEALQRMAQGVQHSGETGLQTDLKSDSQNDKSQTEAPVDTESNAALLSAVVTESTNPVFVNQESETGGVVLKVRSSDLDCSTEEEETGF